MKCEKCGAEIGHLMVNTFFRDGSDGLVPIPLVEVDGEQCVWVDTNANWTGYELTEEEMPDSIECPACGQFPFESQEIQVYEIVRAVMFKKGNDKENCDNEDTSMC